MKEADKPFTAEERESAVWQALEHLRIARNLLKTAGAVQTLKRVRGALKSGEGALRHAGHAKSRAERQARAKEVPVYAEYGKDRETAQTEAFVERYKGQVNE